MPFRLDARTLDGGEQVTSLTLETSRLGPIDPRSLTTGTFAVHAAATSPIPLDPSEADLVTFDLDRTVTEARLDRRGDVVLELESVEGQVGGGTLGYLPSRGRNVRLDLAYTVTQRRPVVGRDRRPIAIGELVQGDLTNPEVDAFAHGVSRSGTKYRLYSPPRGGSGGRRGKRPLVVWLHGGGEGASLQDGYYDNETTLRANRGALGFATPEAQRIFGGAYVVAPQSTSFWMEDGDRFAPIIREIVDEVVRAHDVDLDRVYVAGCSNGGYLTMKVVATYPELFAAAVPICGVVGPFGDATGPLIPDDQLAAITTPTWLVASRDDGTVPPMDNTVHAHELIPGSLMTLYDTVTWDGHRFDGHWSWIYVARNDPQHQGTHVWQWMAAHRR
ncbi:PHB depolymerase family esterase [Isoptericola sp. F-RaC21]|uniref:prolyl oligopeptidase family serine peptidase n=1 Tax=Isoptericola sp. F-RaC21 TaxID=3141452 RepID=UPI00315C4A9E